MAARLSLRVSGPAVWVGHVERVVLIDVLGLDRRKRLAHLVHEAPDASDVGLDGERLELERQKAGIVESWLHKCRRKGYRHVEAASDVLRRYRALL